MSARISSLFATLLLVACAPKTQTVTNDLAVVEDLRKPHDLEVLVDQTSTTNDDFPAFDFATPDLAMATDQATPEDFAVPPDLMPPADLTVLPPDLIGCAPPSRSGTLAVAAVTSTGALHVARFAESGGWTGAQTYDDAALTDVAVSRIGSRVAIVGRMNDARVSSAVDDPCTYASVAPAAIDSSITTSVRPAVIGGSAAVDLVFRGSVSGDERLFWSHSVGLGFDLPATQGNLLTLLPPSLVYVGSALHIFFTGTDQQIYDSVAVASGGTATAVSTAASLQTPAAVKLADDSILVLFTTSDTNLSWSRSGSSPAFSTPKQLCDGQSGCFDATNLQPTIALNTDGNAVAIWAGKDSGDGTKNNGVYFSTFDAGNNAWSAASAVTSTEATDLPVAATTGVGTAKLEVVYVRASDGALRHTRLVTSTWQGATSIDATTVAVTAAPALVAIP